MKLVYVSDNMFRELRQKTTGDTVFPGMDLNEETNKSAPSLLDVQGTNSSSQNDFEEPEYTLDYCEDIDDSYNETDGTLSADPAAGYIASS